MSSSSFKRVIRQLWPLCLLLAVLAVPAKAPLPGSGMVPVSTACAAAPGPVDFDGNGRADIAGIDAYNDMRLYTGNGLGSLTGSAPMMSGRGLWNGFKAIAAADFNGDGLADVAGIDAYNDMRLYTGNGLGGLGGSAPMMSGRGLWNGFKAIAAADFNGDGLADIAGIDAYNDMRLYTGNGHGGLGGGGLMWPGGAAWAGFTRIVAGDFNGDGAADIAGIDAFNDMRLYRGNKSGQLVTSSGQPMWPVGGRWNGFKGIAAGDFDGDGYVDIAGIDANNDMRLYRGDGTGHLKTYSGQLMWATGGLWTGFHQIVGLPSSTCSRNRTAILPLGDSITWGMSSTTGNGYRGPLAGLLNQHAPMGSGWLYEGSVQSGDLSWSNEGQPAQQINKIGECVPACLMQAPNGGEDVNLVLLDAGTNDARAGRTSAQMRADMSALLDKILQRAGVRVVVAQVTITTSDSNADVPLAVLQQAQMEFDNGLPALVAGKAPGRVAVVDMRDVPLSADGVHPGDAGYEEMARRWAAALATAGWLP